MKLHIYGDQTFIENDTGILIIPNRPADEVVDLDTLSDDEKEKIRKNPKDKQLIDKARKNNLTRNVK